MIRSDRKDRQIDLASARNSLRKGLEEKVYQISPREKDAVDNISRSFQYKGIYKKYSYFDGVGVTTTSIKHKVPLFLWKPVAKDRDGFNIYPQSLLDKLHINCRGSSKDMDGSQKSKASFLGLYPLKVGNRPGKITHPDHSAHMFLDSEFCPNFLKRAKIDLESWVRVDGSWDSNWNQLNEMAQDTKRMPGIRRFFRVLEEELPKLNLPLLEKPLACEVFTSQYNLSAGCGGDLSPLQSKGKNLGTILETAFEAFERVHKSTDVPLDQTVYTVGGREKRIKDATPGKLLNSRLVLNQDPVSAAFCKAYTSKIEHYLKFGPKEDSPFYLAHSNAHLGWLRYSADVCDGYKCLEGDWESFDTSAHESIIAAAFAMARSFFEDDVEIDKAFFYMYSGFVAKHVVTPDGHLYRIDKGIPSGNAWTSIIGTFVNFILLNDIFKRYAVFRTEKVPYRILCSGDDFVVVILSEYKEKLRIGKLIRWIYRRTGFKIKSGYKFGKATVRDETKCISLLKTCILQDGLPTTSWSDLLSRLLLPNKKFYIENNPTQLVRFLCAQKQCIPRSLPSKVLLSRYLAYLLFWAKFGKPPNLNRDGVIYIQYLKQVRDDIDYCTRKIYFSNPDIPIAETGHLKNVSSLRWSFYNTNYEFGEKSNLVNLQASSDLRENWIYDNFQSSKKPEKGIREKYLDKIVGKRLSERTIVLFTGMLKTTQNRKT
jgi:hypothetical protein